MKPKISSFFQSPANVFLFRHMSPSLAQHYLHALGFLYYLLNRKEKRVIEKNVRDLLTREGKVLSDERCARKVIRETFKGIFTHYFEKMFSAFLDYDTVSKYVKNRFEVQGGDLLAKALAQGKGCILVTAHWGAVEFIPWVLYAHGFPASVILECATARLARCLKQQISRSDTELITSEYGASVFVRAMQSLSANRVLMTQCDEVDVWRKRKNRTIRLFDREIYFDDTIDVISHRSGAPVVAAFLKRAPGNRYTLIIEDVSVEKMAKSKARECFTLWEKYVSLHPEQWYQWKKWKEMKVA